MNRIFLTGRVARSVETHTTQGGINKCNFAVAVQRNFKNENGEREADFFNCVAWRERADYIGKYAEKGQKITVAGRMQTRVYDAQDGQKRTVYEVNVDEVELGEKPVKEAYKGNEGTEQMTEQADGDLPF